MCGAFNNNFAHSLNLSVNDTTTVWFASRCCFYLEDGGLVLPWLNLPRGIPRGEPRGLIRFGGGLGPLEFLSIRRFGEKYRKSGERKEYMYSFSLIIGNCFVDCHMATCTFFLWPILSNIAKQCSAFIYLFSRYFFYLFLECSIKCLH